MKIMELSCKTNYGFEVKSKILVEDYEVDNYYALVGKQINFGELAGKHSEVEGCLELDGIKVIDISDEEAKVIEKYVGRHISGENFFSYFDILDEHYEIIEMIFALVTEEMKEELAPYVLKKYPRRKAYENLNDDNYESFLVSILPYKYITLWERSIEEDDDGCFLDESDKIEIREQLNLAIERLKQSDNE